MCRSILSRCALIMAVVSLTAFGQGPVSYQNAGSSSSRQIPGATKRVLAAIMGMVQATDERTIPGTVIVLTSEDGRRSSGMVGGDGIFRIAGLAPGVYALKASAEGFASIAQSGINMKAGDVLAIELRMQPDNVQVRKNRVIASAPGSGSSETILPYREISRRNLAPKPDAPEIAQSTENNSVPRPDRWKLDYPEWDRYPGRKGEYPYVFGHWYDPFNRNRLKGDYPLFGNTFFSFAGNSTTAVDVRRLYVPSNVAAERPGSEDFFGRGRQSFISQ